MPPMLSHEQSSTAAKPRTGAGPRTACRRGALVRPWPIAPHDRVRRDRPTDAGQLSFHSSTGGCSRSHGSSCGGPRRRAPRSRARTAAGSSSGWYQQQYSMRHELARSKNGTSTPFGPADDHARVDREVARARTAGATWSGPTRPRAGAWPGRCRTPLSMALTPTAAPRPPARKVCARIEAWVALPRTVTENHHRPGVTGTTGERGRAARSARRPRRRRRGSRARRSAVTPALVVHRPPRRPRPPGSGRPAAARPRSRIARAANAWARMPPFMSVEPRPQMRSPSMRPENGSPLVQLAGSPGGHDVDVAVEDQRAAAAGPAQHADGVLAPRLDREHVDLAAEGLVVARR